MSASRRNMASVRMKAVQAIALGALITLKLGSSGIYRKDVAKYRKFLKSRGLSGKVKLKTY